MKFLLQINYKEYEKKGGKNQKCNIKHQPKRETGLKVLDVLFAFKKSRNIIIRTLKKQNSKTVHI